MWVDFTRRNDPACREAHEHFVNCLQKKTTPRVLCFWTKTPNKVALFYEKEIKHLQDKGCLVLCQTTLNLSGYSRLEPNIAPDDGRLDRLIEILGGPEYIRARFDPIIFGFTTPRMFEEHCRYISGYGITRTNVNFLVPSYKDVRMALEWAGIPVIKPTLERQIRTLETIVEIASKYGVQVAACAETSAFVGKVPGLLPARCSDPDWAASLRPDLKGVIKGRPSRKGCGCVYSDDWGIYRNRGGWKCPHQCVYCYAK